MLSFLSPTNLARRSARSPWLTVGLWVALVAAVVFSASSMKTSDTYKITGTDSYKADRLIEQLHGKTPATETVIIQAPEGVTVDDPAFREFVAAFTRKARALTGTVTGISNYYELEDETMVSADRRTTILPVEVNADSGNAMQKVKPLFNLVRAEDEAGGFTVLTVGDGSINHETTKVAEEDLKSAEVIGLPIALLVLLFVFGAAVAAGVPIVLGLLGIVLSVGVTAAISRVMNISSVTVNMITMIGLAVGIDYTLFIVERFREERARGVDKIEAIATAGDTASRAVLVSGITVIIALAGLLIVPAENFKGIALGAITVVIAAVAIALTLLPAVLSLLGDRINWLHLPGRGATTHGASETGFFARTTALVVRHPVVSVVLAVVVLVGAALPVLGIKLGSAGLSTFPDDMETVRAYQVLDREFSAGRISPAQVAIGGDINSPAVRQAVIRLRTMLAADAEFGDATELEVNGAGTIGAFSVLVNGDPTEAGARETVERLRHEYIPAAFAGVDADVHVTGNSANITDYVNTMSDYLPVVIGFVLALSFVLLLMVFRSIVIPVKAIVMNLLSVGAAYGLVVLVFQYGVGAGLLGFHDGDTIAAYLPVFLFAVLFGLSMDYHVFLLSRIQERFDQTRDNTAAVSYGLRSTAHIITGAASIMMVVFGGFALGDMAEIQQTGFGLAVAVFLDATIVRSVLVPASMELLGEWNWYLPSWLSWMPRINVEGSERGAARPVTAVSREPAFEMAGAGGD